MRSEEAFSGVASEGQVRADHGVRIFVWSVWIAMLLVAFFCLIKYTQNIPIAEDWSLVPPLTGHEPNVASWLWSQNNEHRVPLPRLILLLALWMTHGDFRVGMVLSIVTLGGLAYAMIRVAQHLRGNRASVTDAFFPLALLHLGNWENLLWSWQYTFVLSVALLCGVLLPVILNGILDTPRSALIAGTCLMLLPLCGGTGLGFVPLLALWLGYCGFLHLRSGTRTMPRWIGGFLIGSSAVALTLVGFYFVGYERAAWNAPSPSVLASIKTAVQFQALGIGTVAAKSWVVSVIAVMAVLLSSIGLILFTIRRHEESKRLRAWGLLVIFASLVAFAFLMGWGRSGTIAVDGKWPARYVLLAAPALCTAYYVWELYGPRRLRTIVHMGLFLGMCLLLSPNTKRGFGWRNWYRDGVQKVQHDIETGVPRRILAQRHRDFLIRWVEPARLAAYMQMLQDARMGPFTGMRADHAVSDADRGHEAVSDVDGSHEDRRDGEVTRQGGNLYSRQLQSKVPDDGATEVIPGQHAGHRFPAPPTDGFTKAAGRSQSPRGGSEPQRVAGYLHTRPLARLTTVSGLAMSLDAAPSTNHRKE
jgi:hypothetical protein